MKRGAGIIFLCLVCASVLIFFIFPKTGLVTASIDASTLNNIKLKARVECLQNSQCSSGSECLNSVCVDEKEINICNKVSLSTTAKSLSVGEPINSAKRTLTGSDLPYLLTDGRIDEILNGNLTEHLYSPSILIGNSTIEENGGNYDFGNNGPIYTYKIIFSRGVDFSSKNIQGQVLRILGQEYVINSNSDNSHIYLSLRNNNIELQNNGNTKITQEKDGNVILIEISFSSLGKISTVAANNVFADQTFNAIKLSFNSVDNNYADINIGGNC